MRVDLPADVVEAMEAERTTRDRDEVELARDAFMAFGGMGPCRYITRDGRFLVGADEFWDEPALREATDDEAIEILRIGAKRFSCPALVGLMPSRSGDVADCSGCNGSGWTEGQITIVCPRCHGLGWKK